MKKIFVLTNVLLITAAVYFCVKSFYQITTAQISQPATSRMITERRSENHNSQIFPLSHYANISERNLFNTKNDEKDESQKAPEPVVEVKPEIQPTELKLKLWGTVSSEGTQTYAIIEDLQKREQNLYRVGDAVNIASVKSILREKVILNVDGRDEVLEMEKLYASETPVSSADNRPPGGFPAPASDNGNQVIKLGRSTIDSALNNVNSLMRQASIRPHFKDGKPDGLTLTRVRPDSIFSKLGLRSGDVITGVDGKKIESVDDALQFYQGLKSADKVDLQIKRRGESKIMNYQIE